MPRPLIHDLLLCHFVASLWSSFLTRETLNSEQTGMRGDSSQDPLTFTGKVCSHQRPSPGRKEAKIDDNLTVSVASLE